MAKLYHPQDRASKAIFWSLLPSRGRALLLLARCVVAVALLVALRGPLLPGPRSAGAAPAAIPTRVAGTPAVGAQGVATATVPPRAPTAVPAVAPSVAPQAAPAAAPTTAPSGAPSPAPQPSPAPRPAVVPQPAVAPQPSDSPAPAPATAAATGTPAAATATAIPAGGGAIASPGLRGTPRAATPGASAAPSPGPAASPSPAPSPSPSAAPSPSPSPSPAPPFDPLVPAGPLAMPGDGAVLPAAGDWRTAVTTEARRHLGVPYVWGAQTPAGWDCSGFVLWVFQRATGAILPRVAGAQAGVGVNVAPADIQPGDLVFFKDTYAPGISHVGIALGGGRFIHASSLGAGTTIGDLGDAYYRQHYAGARRPLAETAASGASGGTPTTNPGVPPPPAGPAVAPAQLLPTFAKAAATTGVPREILLAIARVESGFDPRAVGPYLAQFAGTENQHALGLMQFLPATYRPYAARIDGITGKRLGLAGIWDAESAIYAAAFYLRDSSAPGELRRALFAYNHADWYVELILAWAARYAGGLVADPNLTLGPGGGGPPLITVAPENPLHPALTGRHLDALSSIPLYLPFTAGETWYAGGDGAFYGEGAHNDDGGMYYDVDFNKGTWPRGEDDEGAPVLAAADGLVNNVYATAGGGWTVELYHRSPQGTLLRSHYLHLRDDPRRSAGIAVNQPVPHGTTIGFVGSTGSTATGAHLHFGLALWADTGWLSLRPEPLEGQFLRSGLALVSRNDPANRAAFDAAWNAADRQVHTGERRSWLWGPQPLAGAVAERDGAGDVRVVQYWDKGRMERVGDRPGGLPRRRRRPRLGAADRHARPRRRRGGRGRRGRDPARRADGGDRAQPGGVRARPARARHARPDLRRRGGRGGAADRRPRRGAGELAAAPRRRDRPLRGGDGAARARRADRLRRGQRAQRRRCLRPVVSADLPGRPGWGPAAQPLRAGAGRHRRAGAGPPADRPVLGRGHRRRGRPGDPRPGLRALDADLQPAEPGGLAGRAGQRRPALLRVALRGPAARGDADEPRARHPPPPHRPPPRGLTGEAGQRVGDERGK